MDSTDHVPFRKVVRESESARFLRFAGMTKEKARKLATHGLSDVSRFSIKPLFSSEPDLYALKYRGPGYFDEHIISFQKGRENDNFCDGLVRGMFSARKDRTLGRHMMGNRMVVRLSMGFTAATYEAGDMMGGYRWAKCAFETESGDWVSSRLKTRYDLIAPLLDGDQRTWLYDICSLKDPLALYKLAKSPMTVRVPPDIFNKAQKETSSDYPDKVFQDYARKFKMTEMMPIGMFMLCGLRYEITLNFSDAARMRLFEKETKVPVRALAHSYKNAF